MQRIGNEADAEILKSIQHELSGSGVTSEQLRQNVNALSEHDVATSLKTHGPHIHEVLQRVELQAGSLSMQEDNEEVLIFCINMWTITKTA